MGQTLNHGVYLPAEGERNCYSGLASNWNLLDTALGDIDGKASATHTHGSITNDGKLATANRVLVTDGNKVISLSGVTDTELSYLSGVTSAIQTQLNAKAADSDVVHKTGNESIAGIKTFLNTNIRFNASSYVSGTPSDNIFYAPILIGGVVNNTDKNTFQHNAAIRTTGINDYSIRVYSQTSNTLTGVVAETNADASNISFRPIANGTHNLGTSSYQWKTLNGINPGALSLPSGNAENINVTNWDFSWNANTVTAPFDGYISIACFGSALQINNETKSYVMTFAPGSDGFICGLLPVSSGDSIKVLVTRTQTSSYEGYKFIKAHGNVS